MSVQKITGQKIDPDGPFRAKHRLLPSLGTLDFIKLANEDERARNQHTNQYTTPKQAPQEII
jgi:hypothetical protein